MKFLFSPLCVFPGFCLVIARYTINDSIRLNSDSYKPTAWDFFPLKIDYFPWLASKKEFDSKRLKIIENGK